MTFLLSYFLRWMFKFFMKTTKISTFFWRENVLNETVAIESIFNKLFVFIAFILDKLFVSSSNNFFLDFLNIILNINVSILLNFFLQNLFMRRRSFNLFWDSFNLRSTDSTTWFDVDLFKIIFELLVFFEKNNNSLFSMTRISSFDWSDNFFFKKKFFLCSLQWMIWKWTIWCF